MINRHTLASLPRSEWTSVANVAFRLASEMTPAPVGDHGLLYDYRGFGKSGGIPDYGWAKSRPYFSSSHVGGKSGKRRLASHRFWPKSGGSVAISSLGGSPERFQLAALATEGAPSSLRTVAREALGSSRLTWALQYPMSLLVADGASPLQQVDSISPFPLLLIHSREDNIVPFHHGGRLMERTQAPALWLPVEGPHVAAFSQPENQRRLVDFFDAAIARRVSRVTSGSADAGR